MSISATWGSYILENMVVASIIMDKTLARATLQLLLLQARP